MKPDQLLAALRIWNLGEKVTALKKLPIEQSFSIIEITRSLQKREQLQRLARQREAIELFTGVFATSSDTFEWYSLSQCLNGMFYWKDKVAPFSNCPELRDDINNIVRILQAYTGKKEFIMTGFPDNGLAGGKFHKFPYNIEALCQYGAPTLEVVSASEIRKNLDPTDYFAEKKRKTITETLCSIAESEIPDSCRYVPAHGSIVIMRPSYNGTLWRRKGNTIPALGVIVSAIKDQKDGVRIGYGIYHDFIAPILDGV